MKVKKIIISGVMAVLGIFGTFGLFGFQAVVSSEEAFAARTQDPICASLTDSELRAAAGCDNTTTTLESPIKKAINVLLWAVGLLAVVMIIVSGVKMTTSAGDAGAVQKAKNTLIYSIVGLVIAILAYAIVNFVVKSL